MKTQKPHLLWLLAGLLTACGTTTMITGSWRKDNVTVNGYHKIFVAAMTNNIPVKQAVENGLQQQLSQKGITVEKSIDVFPPDFSTQTGAKKELILGKIQGTGADGILTVALLRQETESRYIPGAAYYNPGLRFGYYHRFWNYYSNWYPSIYSPGYYDQQKVYYLETNLYNAKTEELIWAAQSKTYDPTNLDSFLKGYIKAIEAQMVKDGLISGSLAPSGR
jgi:pectate lyase